MAVATEVAPLITVTGSISSTTTTTDSGNWKDGVCACCSQGVCHPSLWCAWCCPHLLMGQILARQRMTWLGGTRAGAAVGQAYHKTFWTILALVVVYGVAMVFLSCPPELPTQDEIDQLKVSLDDDTVARDIQASFEEAAVDYEECPEWRRYTVATLQTIFSLYTLVVMVRLRVAVRKAYHIPATSCCGGNDDGGGGCVEDCCCVFWCGCCTVSQLARQTADYDHVRAVCCSTTGLPSDMMTSSPKSMIIESDLTPAIVV